ncbi:uncharacterized protein LTR77_010173 [Saxophila tyrrhenica]|uniref:Uncharacterized protein n=1 Tax=Saxophila tyrrhenica TaxID=1690608 RepID=A0AAV9NYW4_9PEZI|nr:hypothetical protein LTR77_010173 [Saxophila tyrrhenica]
MSTDTIPGSKASSPNEQRNATDFQFLNFSHPSDAKDSRARKTVRSHVTKQQHQREHAAAAARRTQSFPQPEDRVETDDIPAPRPHAATYPSNRPAMDDPDMDMPLPLSRITGSPEESSQSPSPISSPSEQRIDPSTIYPAAWRSSLNTVTEYYLNFMAADMPDMERPDRRGLLRSRFLPLCLTDPAPLHAFVLMAASHYGNANGPQSHNIDIQHLRSMAMSEVNGALQHRSRSLSDQMIAAVTMLASYEALSGNHDIFRTHMTGLRQMVGMRGGLPALGVDGILERALLWVDANAAHITGSRIYFDNNTFPSSVEHPRPHPRRFSGGSPRRQSP